MSDLNRFNCCMHESPSGVESIHVLKGPPIQVVGVVLITEFYDRI